MKIVQNENSYKRVEKLGNSSVGVRIIKSVVSNWKMGFQKGKGSKEEI